MQKILVNYSNFLYRYCQKKNSKSAIQYGFDDVFEYSPKSVDSTFKQKNAQIFSCKRGDGYWLWKPYIIHDALEKLNEGDILFYMDSGAQFISQAQPLIDLVSEYDQDIIPFEIHGNIESSWTKRDLFLTMDCDSEEFTHSAQRKGSYLVLRKSAKSVAFTNDYLALAQNYQNISDCENLLGLPNYPDFEEHRHDQSIYSLLTKKYQLNSFRDPSQFGNDSIPVFPNSSYGQIIDHSRRSQLPFRVEIYNKLYSLFR